MSQMVTRMDEVSWPVSAKRLTMTCVSSGGSMHWESTLCFACLGHSEHFDHSSVGSYWTNSTGMKEIHHACRCICMFVDLTT